MTSAPSAGTLKILGLMNPWTSEMSLYVTTMPKSYTATDMKYFLAKIPTFLCEHNGAFFPTQNCDFDRDFFSCDFVTVRRLSNGRLSL